MAQFKALSPKVEVSGAAIYSVLQGMDKFRFLAEKILAKNKIENVKITAWYPQQAWLNAFREIADKTGVNTLKAIGRKIPTIALWPPSVHTIEEALASINTAYRMNHRNGEVGSYIFTKTGENSGKIVCTNPYPCMFDFGIVEATALKFKPLDKTIFVEHDQLAPCRRRGSASCTYLISWK